MRKRSRPLRVGDEARAAGEFVALALHVVKTLGVGVPHVDRRPADGTARGIGYGDVDVQRKAAAQIARIDVGALFGERRVLDEERAEHRRLGRAGGRAIVDRVDQRRDAERVGEQDEFLPLVVGDMAGAGEEIDGVDPLRLGDRLFTDEVVEMAHQPVQDLLQPRIFAVLEAAKDLVGDAVFVEFAHGFPPVRCGRDAPSRPRSR